MKSLLSFALVAGLFVLVEGLDRTGVLGALSHMLHTAVGESVTASAFGAGSIVAVAGNLTNNLPLGLISGSVATAAIASAKSTVARKCPVQ